MTSNCNTPKFLDKLLPQTQCRECGYTGCLPYAEAMAAGKDTIDHCAPGGLATLVALATQLGIDPAPYKETVMRQIRPPQTAWIKEDQCIGCTKCIQACPIDAIVGMAKHMHTIIEQECTGCGLCVEPCPVDCIHLELIDEPRYQPDSARQRFLARTYRLDHKKQPHRQDTADTTNQTKQAYIQAALARVKLKKGKKEGKREGEKK